MGRVDVRLLEEPLLEGLHILSGVLEGEGSLLDVKDAPAMGVISISPPPPAPLDPSEDPPPIPTLPPTALPVKYTTHPR